MSADSDSVWADSIDYPCCHCKAQPGVKCRNTITKHVMPVPHYHRIQAAEKSAS